MESRFQQDFAAVRVHSDETAAHAAESIGAKAFTIGSDIYFGPDRYHPQTPEGLQLLAHELTHVAQRSDRAASHHRLGIDAPTSGAERTAERAADAVARGTDVRIPHEADVPLVQAAFLPDAQSKGATPDLSGAQAKSWTLVSDQTVHVPPTPVPTPTAGTHRARIPVLEDIPYLREPGSRKATDTPTDTTTSINPPPKQTSSTSPTTPTTTPTAATTPKTPEPPKRDESQPVPPKPAETKPKPDEEKSGPAVQAGRGVQVTPGTAQPVVNYAQVTVQWKDAYILKDPVKSLPTWLKGLSFLGEPTLQFQLHLESPASATVDTQALLNLAHASFEVLKHQLDVSIVAGAMLNDIKTFELRQAGKQLTPIPAGLDIEYNVARITPHLTMSLDLQSLLPLTYRQATPTKPGGREVQSQTSFELRFTLEL